MKNFTEIKAKQLEKTPFEMIGADWMLITAQKDGVSNTMTASWGGLGVMWGKNVAFVMIRPQRYTKEYIDASDSFSLCFFDRKYNKELSYLGSVSGRDEAKIEKSKFTLAQVDDTPYFEEANTVILCKKLYVQDMKPECFLTEENKERWYPQSDYHILYIAEITKVLTEN